MSAPPSSSRSQHRPVVPALAPSAAAAAAPSLPLPARLPLSGSAAALMPPASTRFILVGPPLGPPARAPTFGPAPSPPNRPAAAIPAVVPPIDPQVKQEEVRLEEKLKRDGELKVAKDRKRKAEEKAARLDAKAALAEEQKHAAQDEAEFERQMRFEEENRSTRVKVELTKQNWAVEDRFQTAASEVALLRADLAYERAGRLIAEQHIELLQQNLRAMQQLIAEQRRVFGLDADAAARPNVATTPMKADAGAGVGVGHRGKRKAEPEEESKEAPSADRQQAADVRRAELQRRLAEARPMGGAVQQPQQQAAAKERSTCSVCQLAAAEVVYRPCGHSACCARCDVDLHQQAIHIDKPSRCPICGDEIDSQERIIANGEENAMQE